MELEPKKPPGRPIEDWVEKIVRDAQARGEFDHLPGEGKPIPNLGVVQDPDWWIKEKLKTEGFDAAPAPLVLRRTADALVERLATLKSESAVREQIRKANALIAKANALPAPAGLAPRPLFDEEFEVARWRAGRGRPRP